MFLGTKKTSCRPRSSTDASFSDILVQTFNINIFPLTRFGKKVLRIIMNGTPFLMMRHCRGTPDGQNWYVFSRTMYSLTGLYCRSFLEVWGLTVVDESKTIFCPGNFVMQDSLWASNNVLVWQRMSRLRSKSWMILVVYHRQIPSYASLKFAVDRSGRERVLWNVTFAT